MKPAIALGTFLLLTACTNESPVPADASFTCQNTPDCNAQWSRAIAWVSSNSGYKIQTQTDNLIQTYGPIQSDTTTAYTINRIDNGDGSGSIIFHAACGNWIVCIPAPSLAQQSFDNALGN